MKFKTKLFLSLMLCVVTFSSWEGDYNTLEVDRVIVKFDKSKHGAVSIYDKK